MDRPILFSDTMVRAILAGRKTATRRIVNPQPEGEFLGWCTSSTEPKHEGCAGFVVPPMDSNPTDYRRPMCQPGDRLWVRECWARHVYKDRKVYYRADRELGALVNLADNRWRPSIHMPQKLARIFLDVAAVKVERLHDMTDADLKAEGIDQVREELSQVPDFDESLTDRQLFEILWDGLNKSRGFGWDTNPWVWAIGFNLAEVVPPVTTGRFFTFTTTERGA